MQRWVASLPGGQLGFLIVVNILVFVLAFFLDFFELAFIIIPLLGPVAEKMGIDLVWFGVLMAVNMQTSFMHPPFGFALFYLRSVAPHEDYEDRLTRKKIAKVTTGQIYWGAVPFVVIQVVMVSLVIAFPGMVTSSIDKPVSKEAIESIQLETEPGGYGEQEGEKAQDGEEANLVQLAGPVTTAVINSQRALWRQVASARRKAMALSSQLRPDPLYSVARKRRNGCKWRNIRSFHCCATRFRAMPTGNPHGASPIRSRNMTS